jgi:hypothetical protein
MKTLVVAMSLNVGMMLICFGDMAHVNQCRPLFENTFFMGGGAMVAIAALIIVASAFMAMVEFGRSRQKGRTPNAKASQH